MTHLYYVKIQKNYEQQNHAILNHKYSVFYQQNAFLVRKLYHNHIISHYVPVIFNVGVPGKFGINAGRASLLREDSTWGGISRIIISHISPILESLVPVNDAILTMSLIFTYTRKAVPGSCYGYSRHRYVSFVYVVDRVVVIRRRLFVCRPPVVPEITGWVHTTLHRPRLSHIPHFNHIRGLKILTAVPVARVVLAIHDHFPLELFSSPLFRWRLVRTTPGCVSLRFTFRICLGQVRGNLLLSIQILISVQYVSIVCSIEVCR